MSTRRTYRPALSFVLAAFVAVAAPVAGGARGIPAGPRDPRIGCAAELGRTPLRPQEAEGVRRGDGSGSTAGEGVFLAPAIAPNAITLSREIPLSCATIDPPFAAKGIFDSGPRLARGPPPPSI